MLIITNRFPPSKNNKKRKEEKAKFFNIGKVYKVYQTKWLLTVFNE